MKETSKLREQTGNVFENKGTLDSFSPQGETILLAVKGIRGGGISCRLNRRMLGRKHHRY
jgi:hypothetical protein